MLAEAQREFRDKKNFTAAEARMNFNEYLATKEQRFYERELQK